MELSGDDQKSQQRQGAVKRKLECCHQNAKKRMKNKTTATIQCDYCQCLFYHYKYCDQHMEIHECPQCHDIAMDDDVRVHNIRHKQEAQLEKLQVQRQQKMDDDFVLCYIKANRLHEYRSQLDYDPDFDYITQHYRFEKEEWLAFIKKFKCRFLDSFCRLLGSIDEPKYLDEQSNVEFISYLLENGALSVSNAIDFLNILMTKIRYDDYVLMIVSYLFDSGCEMKAEWVARAIADDDLVERIKAKYTFTFDEIHKARKWDTYSALDVNRLKTFYTQLQKHFFNPKFENPFDDFTHVGVPPGHLCVGNRFIHDKQNDQLTMIYGSGYWQKIYPLGSCAEMMDKSLADLIKSYIPAVKMYVKLHFQRFSLNRSRNADRQEDEIKKTELEYDEQVREARKLYFAISMK